MKMPWKLARKLAFMLPRDVAYWAALRVGAHATSGQWSSQVVPDLIFMDAISRWEIPHNDVMPTRWKRIVTAVRSAYHQYIARSGLALGALALEVEKLDAIPEAQRALYVEREGKFHLDVTGMPVVEDVSQLKLTLDKERTRAEKSEKARREFEKRYEGIDPDKTRELMSQFEDADEAKLVAKGKVGIEELFVRRTDKLRKEFEKQLAESKERVEGSMEVVSSYMDRVLDNTVRQAAAKAGVHTAAIEDVLLRARGIFALDDADNAVQFEEDGETIVLGKDGKTPYSLGEWLETMRESAPHWFPVNSSGSGAPGNAGGKGGGREMKRATFDALSPDERNKAMKDKVKLVD